eukprot:1360-Heterococcus_DN1.PRE.2
MMLSQSRTTWPGWLFILWCDSSCSGAAVLIVSVLIVSMIVLVVGSSTSSIVLYSTADTTTFIRNDEHSSAMSTVQLHTGDQLLLAMSTCDAAGTALCEQCSLSTAIHLHIVAHQPYRLTHSAKHYYYKRSLHSILHFMMWPEGSVRITWQSKSSEAASAGTKTHHPWHCDAAGHAQGSTLC